MLRSHCAPLDASIFFTSLRFIRLCSAAWARTFDSPYALAFCSAPLLSAALALGSAASALTLRSAPLRSTPHCARLRLASAAHFNLRDEYLPYKHLIGRVVLDKNPSLRTVVNKLDSISASFRFFEMEVLARRLPSPSPSSDLPASGSSNEPEAEAESEFVVTTHENGCSFTFDFSKVYWNSRLQAEHTRLTDLFAPEDVLADGFAGVGPFALPAAKGRKCLGVFANDLNPASASSLVQNVKANKVSPAQHAKSRAELIRAGAGAEQVEHNVRCYNLDGGEFFRKVVQEAYADPFVRSKAAGPAQGAGARKAAKLARREREREATSSRAAAAAVVDDKSLAAADPASALAPPAPTPSPLGRFIEHFVMNLPATAIDLLGCFRGLYVPLLGRTKADRALFYERWEAYSAARAGAAASAVVSGTVPTKRRRPMVHCYCFTKEGPERYEADICEVCDARIGKGEDQADGVNSAHLVR